MCWEKCDECWGENMHSVLDEREYERTILGELEVNVWKAKHVKHSMAII